MNEKKKCPNCGLLIASDSEKCPYCGCMVQEEELRAMKSSKIVNNDNPKKEKNKFDKSILKFAERNDVSIPKEISLFLVIFVGLFLIAFVLGLIVSKYNKNFALTVNGISVTFFAEYLILFSVFLLILNKDLFTKFKKFLNKRTYLYGISYGFLVIVLTALYSLIISYFYPNLTVNDNESSLRNIIKNYPVFSLIIAGFIGPFCEELGYRLGLFSLIRRWNRVAAYVGTAIVFALIHFSFSNPDVLVELLNIPSYLIAGFVFCYVYDKEGIETSSVAHMTNNCFAIIMTILSGVLTNGQ